MLQRDWGRIVFTTPEEVAHMVVYVCSPQASATTGAARRRRRGALDWVSENQYLFAIGSSSAGNSVITRQPLSVTTTSSSMRAAVYAAFQCGGNVTS